MRGHLNIPRSKLVTYKNHFGNAQFKITDRIWIINENVGTF